MPNPQQVKTFTLSEMIELHKKTSPNLLLLYFVDEYCHKILETESDIYRVEVIVDAEYKYQYRKPKLEIVR